MPKTHSFDLEAQENARKKTYENPAMLACDAKNRHVFKDRAMRNACDSDSCCSLACGKGALGSGILLLTLSLLISEDFWLSLDLPSDCAVFSAHLSEGIKTLRSLRRERKTQKSSPVSEERVNKILLIRCHCPCTSDTLAGPGGQLHGAHLQLPITCPGTTPITILAVNSDHGLSFAGEETRTMV